MALARSQNTAFGDIEGYTKEGFDAQITSWFGVFMRKNSLMFREPFQSSTSTQYFNTLKMTSSFLITV